MRLRFRVVLPILLGTVALGLMLSSYFAPRHGAWSRADIQVCYGLNAPATLVQYFLMRAADKLAPDSSTLFWAIYAVYTLLIFLIWYFVGYEIDFRGSQCLSALARNTRFRAATDVLLICLGLMLVVCAFFVRNQFGFPITAYAALLSVPYFGWAFALIAFYGHDLWNSTTGRTT